MDVEEPTSRTPQAGDQVAPTAKEDAATADSRKDAQEEVMMQHPGWALVLIGALMAVIGLVWLLVPSLPWLGHLPGDVAIERENYHVYFPLTTCILLSLALTGVLWLARLFTR